MYKAIARRNLRKGYDAVTRGDVDEVVKRFADDVSFQMIGDHALGGENRGRAEARDWFKRTHELFPDLKLEADEIVVEGFPWDMRVGSRFSVSATLRDGERYENAGMEYLRIRWGKLVEARLYEDTQKLAAAIARQQSEAATAA